MKSGCPAHIYTLVVLIVCVFYKCEVLQDPDKKLMQNGQITVSDHNAHRISALD